MGKIGQFIDHCVEREPDLMQRVLDRPWGTLEKFVDFDADGRACGCLVGTIGLECGAKPLGIDYWGDVSVMIAVVERRFDMIGGLYKSPVADVGSDVWEHLAARLAGFVLSERDADVSEDVGEIDAEAELRTIALLKRRIARRLAERRVSPALALAEVAR